jgi:hypothetical protein
MNRIPFDVDFRAAFGFPTSAALIGPASHCIRGDINSRPPQYGIPGKISDSLDLEGLSQLLLVDDFIAHSEFVPAFDLANYLAASPLELATLGISDKFAKHPLAAGLGASGFLRLIAALAAIQGGMYRRAFMTLVAVERLIDSLVTKLEPHVVARLRASTLLLFCRLAQVLRLPGVSLDKLNAAVDILEVAKVAPPPGVSILEARSRLEVSPSAALAKLNEKQTIAELHEPTHVLGPFAAHYLHYVLARIYLEPGHWDEKKADAEIGESRQALEQCKHAGRIDPLRDAFLKLAHARLKITQGRLRPETARDLDKGMAELRTTIGQFRRHGFSPGEYLASRYWEEATSIAGDGSRMTSSSEDLQRQRQLYVLALESGVTRYQLESGEAYARKLFNYGRPLAAHRILQRTLNVHTDSFGASELADHPIWGKARELDVLTVSARDNSLKPDALWGLSRFAEDERKFVEEVSKPDVSAIVSISGPSGSGRRILIERIALARAIKDGAASGVIPPRVPTVDGSKRSIRDVQAELDDLDPELGAAMLLYDLDLWGKGAQRLVFQWLHSRGSAEKWGRRCYVSLVHTLEGARAKNLLIQPWVETLQPRYNWRAVPLAERPRDALLLARGFLVRALLEHGAYKNLDEAGKIIFTSYAGRYLREQFTEIAKLFLAMRAVAAGLRVEVDVFDANDGYTDYRKVSLEAIVRCLQSSNQVDVPPRSGRSRSVSRAQQSLGSDILRASAERVRELARLHGNRLSVLADAEGIPRSTLIREWTTRGVINAWYESGGRTRVTRKAR